MIEKHPQLSKAFTGGMPEVSVFWTDAQTGVPCKARFDYLKPRAIVDLKSYENVIGLPVRKAMARCVANYRYHIQAALYLEGARSAGRLIAEGRVFGDVDPGFMRAFVDAPERHFLFVFQQKGPAPLARGMVLAPGLTLDIGREERRHEGGGARHAANHRAVGDRADQQPADDLGGRRNSPGAAGRRRREDRERIRGHTRARQRYGRRR
jgi:hypothetical protein